MFVPIILGSDKTTVSVGTGNNEYYPLYLSIGNVSNKARRSSKLNTVQLVAFLSIPKSTYTSMNMLHILLVLFWSTWQLSGGTRNRMTFADLGNRYFIRPYLISSAHWRAACWYSGLLAAAGVHLEARHHVHQWARRGLVPSHQTQVYGRHKLDSVGPASE